MTAYTFESIYPEPSAAERAIENATARMHVAKANKNAAIGTGLLTLASGIASIAFIKNGHIKEGIVAGLCAYAFGDLALNCIRGHNK